MFEIKSSTSGLFRFYRTPTALTSERLAPQIRSIGEVPYLLVPTESSFQVYGLQDLSLHFLGPRVPRVSCVHYSSHSVVLCERDAVHSVDRGEIVSTHPVPGGDICEMLKFGDCLVVRTGAHTLIVYACAGDGGAVLEERYRVERKETVCRMYHPHTYTNKMLIIYDSGRMELFNLHTRKTIFSFDLRTRITAVCQTSVLDVLGLGLEDGTVRIFNLRKNRTVFDIPPHTAAGGAVTHLDFMDRHCLAVAGGVLRVYDLELKKEVFSRRGVFHGLAVNRELFLVTTAESIEIYNAGDFTVLKKRCMPSGQIDRIEARCGKEILLFGAERLFKMNVYSDEQSCFLKSGGAIERASVHDHVVLYGDRQIRYLDREGASFSLVDRRCDWIKTHGDFCFFGAGDVSFIMNLRSRRVVLEHREPGAVDGDLNNEKFTVLTRHGFRSFDYRGEEVFSHALGGGRGCAGTVEYSSIRIVGNLYFLKGEGRLSIVCSAARRDFGASRYALDPTNKFLAVICDQRFLLYDVLSGNVVEELRASVGLKDVAIVDGLKFVALLDVENSLHLLSNHSFFVRITNTYLALRHTHRPLEIAVARRESNFSKEMACYKEFGTDTDVLVKSLSRADVQAILGIVESNMSGDFRNAQAVLERVLRYKSHLVEPQEVEGISRRVEARRAEYEDKLVKCIGYLELCKNNML